jgi:hypothetical protein
MDGKPSSKHLLIIACILIAYSMLALYIDHCYPSFIPYHSHDSACYRTNDWFQTAR